MDSLFYFSSAKRHEPEIDAWLSQEPHELTILARRWFDEIRACGADVNELIHDGYPVACVNEAAFAYVNVFTAHVNIGFFTGALLEDPGQLLLGTGKRMRHVKLKPGEEQDSEALKKLITAAYLNVKNSLKNS